jgi:gluconolactonase
MTVTLCALATTIALGQEEAPRLPPAPANPPAPSLQSTGDPGYAALIATCKTPPPARGGRPGGAPGGGARPGGGAAGAAPAGAPRAGGGGGPAGRGGAAGPREYTVSEIPGVIAAGQRWKFIWQEAGKNGDGIVGTDDGGLLVAQNDNSRVLKLDASGKPSTVYSDTHTGGALSMSPNGALFINQRGLRATVGQLTPQRRVLADTYNGDPLDCIGGVINDLTADSKGGAYFTMGGVFYASSKGVVTRYGENLQTNGVILSADEKVLYVTNGATLAAFDVQPDGSLTNQREFAKLESGGDGCTIDAAGRIYVTINAGVQIISPDGKSLGVIPTPRGVISGAFGGKDKKTFYILARGTKDAEGNEVGNAAQVWAIQMLAQGYKGRAK